MTDTRFKVGTTYYTKNGREARIYATDGAPCKDSIHGAYRDLYNNWISATWWKTGVIYGEKSNRFFDLIPPDRPVIITKWFYSEGVDGRAVRLWLDQHPHVREAYNKGPVDEKFK